MQNASKITKNNSQGVILVIISWQRSNYWEDAGKKKACTALLQCRTFRCRKKWGPPRKGFSGRYGFLGLYRVFVSTTGLESFSLRPEMFAQNIFFRWWSCTLFSSLGWYFRGLVPETLVRAPAWGSERDTFFSELYSGSGKTPPPLKKNLLPRKPKGPFRTKNTTHSKCVIRVVFLLSHCELLSRRTLCGHRFSLGISGVSKGGFL